VGAWTLLALLDEFASNSRSVVGLSWEYHHTCQQANPPPHISCVASRYIVRNTHPPPISFR
jgi:hypothetical protein